MFFIIKLVGCGLILLLLGNVNKRSRLCQVCRIILNSRPIKSQISGDYKAIKRKRIFIR